MAGPMMNLPSFIPSLAHSYNSRGELGAFVNPYNCSCTTCVNHVAAETLPLPLSLPPPPSISDVDAAEALLELSREPVVNFYESSSPALGRTVTGFHYSPSMMSPPTGGLGLFSATHGALSFAQPEPTVSLTQDQVETVSVSLHEYREVLRERQDKVYDTDARSHDEMAAQDMEFEEIDRKITELDDILSYLDSN